MRVEAEVAGCAERGIRRACQQRIGVLLGVVALASVGCSTHIGPCETEDDAPPGMVRVAAGSFVMGDGESQCGTDQRHVTITRDFYLGLHEVTNQQYLEAVQWAYDRGHVSANVSSVHDALDGSTEELLDLDALGSEISFLNGTFSLRDAGHGINPSHPVKEVSWFGAARYCDWLSLMTGLPRAYEHAGDWSCNGGDPYAAAGYRMPTDAEWEYAARYDDGRLYPWGSDAPSCDLANYSACEEWTSQVGSYPAAPETLGLRDMAGNVLEWCDDCHVCDLGEEPATDPAHSAGMCNRVTRGGSWGFFDAPLRCAYRGERWPGGSFSNFGFRVARTASSSLELRVSSALGAAIEQSYGRNVRGVSAEAATNGDGPRKLRCTTKQRGGVDE